METFYISDLHFNHFNVIDFDKRPFKTLQEMNDTLVEKWNKRVKNNDTVYILGDLLWDSSPESLKILKSLNGKKILIIGNHDWRWIKNKDFTRYLYEMNEGYKLLKIDKRKIILSHYPIMMFDGVFHGNTYHLYGHIHTNELDNRLLNKWKSEYEKELGHSINMYNVGCMLPYMNYEPKTLNEIKEVFKKD